MTPDDMGDWPSTSPAQADWTDPDQVEGYIRDLLSMEACGTFVWAEDTIRDIRGTIEKTGRVTPGQRRAIQNIEDGAERGRRRRSQYWGRRGY